MTWTRRHTQLTTATPAQIWARWTSPAAWADDDPGLEYASFDRVRTGAEGTVKNHGTPAQRFTFTRVEPERAMDLTLRLPGAALSITHDLEAADEGLRVTHGVRLEGPLHRLYAVALGGRLARGLPEVVRRVTAGALTLDATTGAAVGTSETTGTDRG